MALTTPEAVQLVGRAIERVGKKLEETPDVPLTAAEILELVQATVVDIVTEASD